MIGSAAVLVLVRAPKHDLVRPATVAVKWNTRRCLSRRASDSLSLAAMRPFVEVPVLDGNIVVTVDNRGRWCQSRWAAKALIFAAPGRLDASPLLHDTFKTVLMECRRNNERWRSRASELILLTAPCRFRWRPVFNRADVAVKRQSRGCDQWHGWAAKFLVLAAPSLLLQVPRRVVAKSGCAFVVNWCDRGRASFAPLVATPSPLVNAPEFDLNCATVKGLHSRLIRTGPPCVVTAPELFHWGPGSFPMRKASVAVEGNGGCQYPAGSVVVVAAPVLLWDGPLVLPVPVPYVAVKWHGHCGLHYNDRRHDQI